jgi:bla regulator protein BlaR1
MILVTHLWQSTLCAGVAALLTVVFRHASARTRHTIWLAASVKFLVPFSLFVLAGRYIGALTTPEMSVAVRWLDESWALWSLDVAAGRVSSERLLNIGGTGLVALTLVWACGTAALTAWRWKQWRRISRLTQGARRPEYGREAESLKRVSRTSTRPRHIDLLVSESSVEPGVVGIFRPKLLWPTGLSDRLSDAELEAVLAHEACHVDRLDNLSALVQMVVETVFWFHPIVWWLGARLVSERELACDEEVLRMREDTRSYAEGILKVCAFCLRAPAAFVAGVGGSNLTRRIERILSRPTARSLSLSARLLLGGVVVVTAGAPLVSGVLSAHRAEQDQPTVHRPGKGITMPKLVYEVKPLYTKEAMDARIQGTVWLAAVVLESGDVGEVEIVQSLDREYGLDDQAVMALKQWRFEPGTRDKKPVAVRVEVEMSFKLK